MSLGTLPLSAQILGTPDLNKVFVTESELSVDWDILVFVATNLELVWDSLEFVYQSSTFIWNIAYLVDADLLLKWDSMTAIEKDLSMDWSILGDTNFIVSKNVYCKPKATRTVNFCG